MLTPRSSLGGFRCDARGEREIKKKEGGDDVSGFDWKAFGGPPGISKDRPQRMSVSSSFTGGESVHTDHTV